MNKKLWMIIVLALVLVACGGNAEKKTPEKKAEPKVEKKADISSGDKLETKAETPAEKKETAEAEKQSASVEDYLADPGKYVGKELTLSGTVVHVCKHGGKKLFIIGKDPEKRVKFTSGKGMAPWDIKLEGSKIEIKGVVVEQRVNEETLAEMEKNLKDAPEGKKEEHAHKEGDDHEKHAEGTDHHHASKGDQMKNIQKMREKIKKSEKGYLSFYSLECSGFKVLDK